MRRVIPRGRAPYRRGYALERRVLQRLRAGGWVAVRSPQSRGDYDILAIRGPRHVLVECKRNGICPPDRRAALRDAQSRAGRTAEAVVVDGRYRVRAVDRWDDGWERWDEVF